MKFDPVKPGAALALCAGLLTMTAASAQQAQPAPAAQPAAAQPAAAQPAAASGAQQDAVEREGSLVYKDPRLDWGGQPAPTRTWHLTLPRALSSSEKSADPKTNRKYPFHLRVVCKENEEDARPQRRFLIHFLHREDEPLARKVGSLLARLYWIGRDYLGRGQADPDTWRDVWLTRDGQPGGEEYRGNLYLFAVHQPRPAAEWAREIAHEYSHLLLPEMGRYTEPEPNANGYLGERLLLKWLLADNGVTDFWFEPIDGAGYVANQVTPLIRRFLDQGPAAPAAQATNAEGMDHLLGYILALEAMHGPIFVRQLLNRFATPKVSNMGLYLTATWQDIRSGKLPLNPAMAIPSRSRIESGDGTPRFHKASYWVFLPRGDWRIDVEGVAPAEVKAALEAAELKPADPTAPGSASWLAELNIANAVWRRLDLTAASGKPLEVRRIQIVNLNPLPMQ